MGRKILFVTTDQQRFDSLGCNGGEVARTPVVDALAESGIRYLRAHAQNVTCMPARSTMLTGQHLHTHGVYASGVPLPADARSVAEHLATLAGYRCALIGKGHFEPEVDFESRWPANRLAGEGSTGPYRGFEHVELVTHTYWGRYHYDAWLDEHHPGAAQHLPFFEFHTGESGAPDVPTNPMSRDQYHTDWVAARVIAFLDTLPDDADWFVWASFPDPHSPWNPPASELHRVPWRDLDVPAGYPGSHDRIVEILARKPHHWLATFEGRLPFLAANGQYVPSAIDADQVREVNAVVHVENELIDEAVGRVLAHVADRGWAADTDVVFTTDHGELQGDFGFFFKGPFHVDALMRLPFVWRPAPSLGVAAAVVPEPVGQVDLAPTFCAIAGVPAPEWMQGAPLPTTPGSDRSSVVTEWDSQDPTVDVTMRSIFRGDWLCTAYEASTLYEGTEGELYDLTQDPLQWENRWDDPACRSLRSDLVADLYDNLPDPRTPRLPIEAPF